MPRREYCTCHGAEHGLIKDVKTGFAKQCQNCGNIYCMAQGDGDCLFCGVKDAQLSKDAFQSDLETQSYNQHYKEADIQFFKDNNAQNVDNQEESQALLQKALSMQENIYKNVEAGMPDDDVYEMFDCQGDNVDCERFC